jgi:serine/threonine protein kinase
VLAARMLDHLGKDHLLKEAQTASALNHPNICTIYQVGQVDHGFYLVMELVEGQPLSEMARGTKLRIEEVTRYGVQIADALAHAHDRQIIHRDLKGGNVVITPDGRVKVLDFGLARRLDKETVDAITRSQASVERDRSIVGTLPYMAPEILTGEGGSYQSDIWALGVLLYEAITGQLPFAGSTPFGLSAAILHELPRPLPPGVPPGLSAIIMRCLAKDLKDRYRRASDIRMALETIQSAAIVSEPRREEPTGSRTLVLRGIQHLDVKNGDVLLLLGTTKGAFLARSRQDRKHWDVAGPYFHGHSVYSLAYDHRNGRHRLWASTGSPIWGTYLRSSDDFGKTWTNPLEATIRFPPESGLTHLEDRAGAPAGAGQAVLRRGSGRAFRVPGCRRIVDAGARTVRSSPSAALDDRAGRFVSAHDPLASDRARPHPCRHFRGRRVPDR